MTPVSTDLVSAATRLMSGDATTEQPNLVRLSAKPFADVMSPLYSGLVRRLVLVLGNREDAEDVAQDAYERAYRSWSKFDGRDPRAWLYTIALRLAFNQLERRRNWGRIISRSTPGEWTDAVDPDLLSARNSLQPRVRACILLLRRRFLTSNDARMTRWPISFSAYPLCYTKSGDSTNR